MKVQNNRCKKEGKGENTMCEALDKLINEGEKRGMERGIERGTLQTLYRLIESRKITVDDAAKDMGLTEEDFIKKIKEAGYKISE